MKNPRLFWPAILILGFAAAGCGSVPPTPVDRFYRLQPVTLAAPAKALPAAIAVAPFEAESIYAERPVLHSEEANPRQLRQYHYHLWLYAPARAVREHLIASAGGALKLADGAPLRLEGRVLRFERVTGAGNGKAVAALHLRLVAGERTLLDKTYEGEQAAAGDSISAFVAAMEQALARIYGEFLRDAQAAGAFKAG